MTTVRMAGIALALALAAPAAANATITITTYKGYVESGFDGANLFHVAGGDLTGQGFSVTYTIDDSVAASSNYVVPTQSNLEGGSVFPSESPVSAVFTLNHYDYDIVGLRYSYARGLNIPNYVSQLAHTSGDYTSDNFGEHGAFVSARIFSQIYSHSDIPSDYHQAYSHTQQGGDGGDGEFKVYGNNGIGHAYLITDALLHPTSVVTSGAPEPASWALMVLGVGGVGAMLRRRSLKVGVPA